MPIYCIPVTEASQVAAARRTALQMTHSLGLSEVETGALALVVTEAATNLVKHAQAGQLLLRTLDEAEGPGVELLALDTGPGMAHVGQCLQDGYSTAGSPGTGLGAITRLATLWDLYSVPGQGTSLLAQGSTPGGSHSSGAVAPPLCAGPPGGWGCLRAVSRRDGVWGCLDGGTAGGALPRVGGGWIGPWPCGSRRGARRGAGVSAAQHPHT
jgi:anti-sigma regulatory factor (Ser/Thr protein kinase)